MMHSIKIVICGTGPTPSDCGLMMSIYFNSNRTSQPFLTNPAMSSLSPTYDLVGSPYLAPVVKFIACKFGLFASACSTPVFYRRTVESILTGSSAAHRTLTFSIRTTLPAQ
jgi:hypothetical protein